VDLSPRPSWLYLFVGAVSWPVLKIVFRHQAHGVENVPRSGGLVLAANHWSNFDPWPLGIALFPRRFLRFYLICGVGAGLLIVTVPMLLLKLGVVAPWVIGAANAPTLGASGAIFGVLLAYSLTWPDRTIMFIFPPVAFRAIWLIPILFFMEIYFGPPNVSHTGHLGGVLVGWLLLRSQGEARGLLSLEQIRWRFRRWRMRRRLRAVHMEQRRDRDSDRPYFH